MASDLCNRGCNIGVKVEVMMLYEQTPNSSKMK